VTRPSTARSTQPRTGSHPQPLPPAGIRHPLPPPPGAFYWTLHALPRILWRPFGSLEVHGLDNVPQTGPFLLISNHQSMLDPFFIQTVCRRPCHAMAKSTQFDSRFSRFIMRRCYAFPVRRYRIDPQAVRVTLRRLQQGFPVHIYIEGERTWDGGLQPPRPGTVRIALKAGVPIVPCAIDGAYDVWPRWGRAIPRGHVRVSYGPAFKLPQLHGRVRREAAVPEATDRIMRAIADLLGTSARTSSAADA
jgi:1-acyl-sn-glycerol-3-phosphate acyltransferase